MILTWAALSKSTRTEVGDRSMFRPSSAASRRRYVGRNFSAETLCCSGPWVWSLRTSRWLPRTFTLPKHVMVVFLLSHSKAVQPLAKSFCLTYRYSICDFGNWCSCLSAELWIPPDMAGMLFMVSAWTTQKPDELIRWPRTRWRLAP